MGRKGSLVANRQSAGILLVVLAIAPLMVLVPVARECLLEARTLGGESDSTGHHRLSDTTRIVFLSDSQEPLWPETLRLPRNNNASARQSIFREILNESPDAVVHLGDMAALGFLRSSWAATDTFVAHLDARRIPFYPILGNHELIFFPSAGLTNFQDRFPGAGKTGYMRRFGPVALVLLNSNISNLSIDEGKRELDWYAQTLGMLQADSTVRLIVVACHHSPYTNSTIVSPSSDVRTLFVPRFLAAPKARLFLSGHAHAAEYFRNDGKDFLVIGGGGGLQQPLLVGEERRWVDLFPEETPTRMFHFLLCTITDREIVFSVVMLRNTFDGFRIPLILRYPVSPTPALPVSDSSVRAEQE